MTRMIRMAVMTSMRGMTGLIKMTGMTWVTVASHADILRGSSCVPAPLMSAEPKDKFLSHCLQISAGDHMQIIRDPISPVELKVLTNETHMPKLGRV